MSANRKSLQVVGKTGKKGQKKGQKKQYKSKVPYKMWFDVKAPSMFARRRIGRTCVTKTKGKTIEELMVGRIFEVSLGDLQGIELGSYRYFKLKCEAVQQRSCLTSFYGMTISSSKRNSLLRKWRTLIEAECSVRTTDGYILRIFVMGITGRRKAQVKLTSYATKSQAHMIRKIMTEVMDSEASSCTLNEFVGKLINDTIALLIRRKAACIYPMHNVTTRKVKLIKSLPLDIGKLMEMHTGQPEVAKEDVGTVIDEITNDQKNAAKEDDSKVAAESTAK